MKIVDLHPEELLDKDARGALSEDERALLDAHLARCETCRFERMVRADFALERSEEVGLSAHRLALLVDVGVRERSPSSEALVAEASPPISGRRSVVAEASPVRAKRSFAHAASFAAVVVLVVGAVGAVKFGLDGWGRGPGSVLSKADPTPASSSFARPPTKPVPGMPVANTERDLGRDPGMAGVGAGPRTEPAESVTAPLRVDDEAFFTVESFDESQRDVLDEPWYPRALESDVIPTVQNAPHRKPPHPKGPRRQVAPHAPHGVPPHDPSPHEPPPHGPPASDP